MITITELLLFSGSLFLYFTSDKASYIERLKIEKWIRSNKSTSKAISITCYVAALIIAVVALGNVPGFLLWLFSLMTWFCLLIVFVPLPDFSYRHVLIGLLLTLLVEIV